LDVGTLSVVSDRLAELLRVQYNVTKTPSASVDAAQSLR
jgi:hypothetical protein